MLADQPLCALCRTPTRARCSRCKAVYYCSFDCQGRHWKEGHRLECNVSRNVAGKTSDGKEQARCASDGSLAKPKKVLFPYEYFVKFFHCDILRFPCGLINCGNSCYANVVLQCLTFTRPLAAYLLRGMHQDECQRSDWCLMCELEDHVRKAFRSQVPFSPTNILSRLRSIGNSLGYGRQEDAHEFMRFAVDSMQKICLDEAGGETSLDARSQETTLIQHIFGGHLQSQVKCSQCYHESNRYENMLDMTVEIQGAVESLEDALAQFTAAEWLDGDNKYRCDRCNAYVRARKRLAVHEAPNILTIALKRFQSGKFGKINKKVTFPEELNLLPYMSGKGDRPPVYNLYAVVVHVDMLNASYFGHYVCYVKDRHGTWFKVDDSKVKEVEKERVMSQRAYMLFYSRSLVRARPVVEDGSSSMTSTSDSGVIGTSSSLGGGSSDSDGELAGRDGEISSEIPEESPFLQESLVVAGDYRRPSVVTREERGSFCERNMGSSAGASYQVLESSDSSIESGFPQYMDGARRAGKRRLEVQVPPVGGNQHTSSCSTSNQACFSGIPGIPEEAYVPLVSGYEARCCGAAPEQYEVMGTCDEMDVEGSILQSSVTSLAGECSNAVVSSTAEEVQVLAETIPVPGGADCSSDGFQVKRPRTSESCDDTSAGNLAGCEEGSGNCNSAVPATKPPEVSENSKHTAGSLQPMFKRGFLNRPAVQRHK